MKSIRFIRIISIVGKLFTLHSQIIYPYVLSLHFHHIRNRRYLVYGIHLSLNFVPSEAKLYAVNVEIDPLNFKFYAIMHSGENVSLNEVMSKKYNTLSGLQICVFIGMTYDAQILRQNNSALLQDILQWLWFCRC